MDDVDYEGAAGAETSRTGAVAAPGRDRRMTAGRKRDAVLRVLRGEPLKIVAREAAVTAAGSGDGVMGGSESGAQHNDSETCPPFTCHKSS